MKFISCAVFVFFFIVFFFIGKYCLHTPTVTVLMSTYNRAELLPRSIESVLSQTYPDFEFIIIDDGSTDNTWDILTAYQKQDGRIHIYKYEKNLGLIASCNKGLSLATGVFIARMDDDDIALPQWLEKSVNYMQKHPYVTVGYPMRKTIKHDAYPSVIERHEAPVRLLYGNPIGNVGCLIRHDFIKKHHLRYNAEMIGAEDYDFWVQAFKKGAVFQLIPYVLVSIYRHTTNPVEYYKNQNKSRHRISKDFIAYVFDPLHPNYTSMCDLMRQVYEINKTKKLFKEDEIKEEIGFYCKK